MNGTTSKKRKLSKGSKKPSTYRRIVTGNVNGKSVVQSDEPLPAYQFKTVPGYQHTLIWVNAAPPDLSKEQGLTAIPTRSFQDPAARVYTSSRFRPLRSSQIRPSMARPHETKP